MSNTDFWDVIYLDGDYDKDDSYGKWFQDPKYVNGPPHVFVRKGPEPSTDFTIPKGSPGTEYLFWDEGGGWFVGYWDTLKDGFLWTTHDLEGDEYLNPTYWFPLPEAPNNRPNE